MFRKEGFIILILAVLTMTIVGCQGPSDPVTVLNPEPTLERNSDLWTEDYCGEAISVDLIAGQNEIIGEVKVANDGEYLYVEFVAFDPWVLIETHVAVYTNFEDIPLTKKGNPKIGQFAYDIDSLIPLDCNWDKLIIAAHAVVDKIVDGVTVQSETAWGEGPEFPGKSWAMYFNFTVQDCCALPPDGFQARFYNWGPSSYWNTIFYNVPDGYIVDDGEYAGWCVDQLHYIYGVEYTVALYSSYDTNLPDYALDDDWDMVNYILNHKQGTKVEIQDAIWYFINGGHMPGSTAGQAMVADALANGEGYVPSEGSPVAIIVDILSPEPNNKRQQLTIIEIPMCIFNECEI